MHAGRSTVRQAWPQDAAACVAIYRPYVEDTAISWEIEVPTVAEMAARITGLRATHEWLVLECDEKVIGFAYGQPLKQRLASLQWCTETGIYVAADNHRAGGGRQLYTQLLRRLIERGYRQAFAGITSPTRERRLSPIVRVRRCGSVPAGRVETRQLARRGMDATRFAGRR